MSRAKPGPKAVIIDASVALKWYIEERESDRAKRWYKRIETGQALGVVPEYFFLEVSNVLLTRHQMSFDDVYDVIVDLERLGLDRIPMVRVPLPAVIRLASKLSVTTYDALYLELALELNYPLLTTDRELLVAAPKLTRKL